MAGLRKPPREARRSWVAMGKEIEAKRRKSQSHRWEAGPTPTKETYRAALPLLVQLGPGVWDANRALIYNLLKATFDASRDAHALIATLPNPSQRCFDEQFDDYLRRVVALVQPAVYELLKALEATGSTTRAVAIVWDEMTNGFVRPAVDHLLTVWAVWTFRGSSEKDFQLLSEQYHRFRHPYSPRDPPTPWQVVGPRWAPEPDLQFKRGAIELALNNAIVGAVRLLTDMEPAEIEKLRTVPLERASVNVASVAGPILSRSAAKRERDNAIRQIWRKRPKALRKNGDVDYEYVCTQADQNHVPTQPAWSHPTWIANLQDGPRLRDCVKKCIREAIKGRRRSSTKAGSSSEW